LRSAFSNRLRPVISDAIALGVSSFAMVALWHFISSHSEQKISSRSNT
jgi:hypothetical protein